ncbi:LacI family transcriptional regulator [Paenibacillus sp. PK3_47]|uniref:LacI family DNA-binding transcriptional regulator n=1 Tax=Paenibacillus sp. PK3_47 TaxID=2072642 RepID=UPI00201DAE25|nr:LacI family DNA-binding transcriptional regulator [Paenibacillus sp. PK3_47]UQZ32829.1 LacI family transcriptional regulator [Paenibacillus sp. PK3_47]
MATIHDVAKRAGVSVTTVSRVLNNRGYISQKTRQLVYETMEELNYQPNDLARSLLSKQSNVIGLIIPNVSHPFFGEFAYAVEHYAYEQGCKLLLCNSQLDPVKEREYLKMMKGNQVNGIIMGSHTLDTEVYLNLNYPIVTVDRLIKGFPFVASDNELGGRLAAELLISKGCRKIVHICGNQSLDMLSNLRTEGFKSVADNAGIETVILETKMNVFDQKEYEYLIGNMFVDHPDLDGVFATSDIIAGHVIGKCRELGKNVPGQIKIVGYDDVSMASWFSPGITTIRQPIEDMGRMAVHLIQQQMSSVPIVNENIFPVELIERETT